MAKNGVVKLLTLDVARCSVNNSIRDPHVDMLNTAIGSVDDLLPLLANAWHATAPKGLHANVSAKLGRYEKIKKRPVPESTDDKGNVDTVEQVCSTPMVSVDGSKRAVRAMLVASVFAADLSDKERVPVVVLGRPPGHHATCEHKIDLDAPLARSPGGSLEGCCIGGGCFYPSCWVAAVHSLRSGSSNRLAYIDVDAHKPDGIWREVERLRGLGKQRRTHLLGNADRCENVLFASVHIDAFPNPGVQWKSVDTVLPKKPGKAFDVHVVEELLPEGTHKDGTTLNAEVLEGFNRWRNTVQTKLARVKPNGLFVGLGFDLHKDEKQIRNHKRVGLGISRKDYRDFIGALPAAGVQPGPVVLTLEGGYTKEAVVDGMKGTLEGLVKFSRAQRGDVRGVAVKASVQVHTIPKRSHSQQRVQARSAKRRRSVA
eukprot:TRINITY_DN24016_c0_g3_i1.p1 TRINITY_DN24016_c0_g3~~TRINITY_DN24016_c0_g3_i1.p1  ORF type:complete len:481 (-),score=48.57 TRINITY_DN24016_c0_g3_i1:235-1518(-)